MLCRLVSRSTDTYCAFILSAQVATHLVPLGEYMNMFSFNQRALPMLQEAIAITKEAQHTSPNAKWLEYW